MEDYLYRKKKKDLAELKDQLKKAIADEKEANTFYKELINLAQRAEQRGTADKLKAILSQEQSHAEIDWRLLKDTEEAEAKFQKEYEESKKKEQAEKQGRVQRVRGGFVVRG